MNELPTDWVETTLGEVVTISSSKRIFHSDYVTSGIPFYRSKEVIERQKGNDISTALFITEKKFNEIKSKFGTPEKDDLLLTSVGTLGVPYLVKNNEIFYFKDGNLTWFRKYNGLDPNYIYHFFLSSIGKERLNEITIGSTQRALTISGLKNININLPPLDEQKSIADILVGFDDKIELLRAQNKTLETLAQTIFKEWFVKFNFPNATGEMINSELGKIPKGWRVGVLGGVLYNIKVGINANDIQDNIPYIALEHMPRKQIALDKWKMSNNIASNKYQFNEMNILFGKLRPYFHKVGVSFVSGVCSTDILVLKEKEKWLLGFSLMTVSRNEFIKYVTLASEGTRMPRTNWAYMSKYKISIPDEKLLVCFNQILSTFIEKIKNNTFQIKTLEKTRDALLPKLMSGIIRVDN